ncbi:uncharacterized protein [Aquarana catesbeiana]|uniref:uncharacterized protein n=1 Tax=Aquarana catesbeiana TaxID=8400 RepID=UPI003CC97E9F
MSLRSGTKYQADDMLPPTQQGRKNIPSAQQDDAQSHVSRSSWASKMSSAVKARAKAEAAQIQLQYAEKEAMMMQELAAKKAAIAQEEAELESKLLILQRQTAAAEAEAAAYMGTNPSGSEKSYKDSEVPGKPLFSADRTSEYIQNLSTVHAKQLSLKPEAIEFRPKSTSPLSRSNQPHEVSGCQQIKNEAPETPKNKKQVFPSPQPIEYMCEQQCAVDVTKYLIRKEMVSSGFLQFDDCPENYWAWKSSFLNATEGLNFSPAEMLNLMIKWLGTESAEHAKRMRRANLFNPAAGLNMTWKRLEEMYGSPEVIEGALLKKLEVFPKVGYRDNVRLQELSDLLLEIEYAKEDGYLPGLSYLDTARGTNPIVEKLPSNLQDKWMSVGGKFKEDYGVAFPPFLCLFLGLSDSKRKSEVIPASPSPPVAINHTDLRNLTDLTVGPLYPHTKQLYLQKSQTIKAPTRYTP